MRNTVTQVRISPDVHSTSKEKWNKNKQFTKHCQLSVVANNSKIRDVHAKSKTIKNLWSFIWPFKRQPQKMVKHTQTIHRLLVDELLECVWPFKGLTVYILKFTHHIYFPYGLKDQSTYELSASLHHSPWVKSNTFKREIWSFTPYLVIHSIFQLDIKTAANNSFIMWIILHSLLCCQ